LLQEGIQPELAENLIARAQEVSVELGKPEINPVELRQDLKRLAFRVCGTAEQFRKTSPTRDGRTGAKDLALSATWAVVGVAMMGVNAAAATTIGLGAAAVSAGVGSAIVKKVAEELYEKSKQAERKKGTSSSTSST
jgi:hypothetical protein